MMTIQVKMSIQLTSIHSLFCLVWFGLERKESPEGRSYTTLERGVVVVMIDSRRNDAGEVETYYLAQSMQL